VDVCGEKANSVLSSIKRIGMACVATSTVLVTLALMKVESY